MIPQPVLNQQKKATSFMGNFRFSRNTSIDQTNDNTDEEEINPNNKSNVIYEKMFNFIRNT
jgi:hypothetical protein